MTYQKRTRSEPPTEASPDHVHELPFAPPTAGAAIETFSVRDLLEREHPNKLQSLQRVHFELFIWCQHDSGRHELDFVRHELEPGQVLRVRPGQVHRWLLDPPFDAELILLTPRRQTFESARGSVINLTPRASRYLAAAISLVQSTDDEPSLSTRGFQLVRDLVADLLIQHQAKRPQATERDRIFDEFQRVLLESPSVRRTVHDHASSLGCSTRTLTRICHEQADASPKQLVDHAVALEAQRQLSIGDSATTVANDLGFAELSQFTRFFRRVTGQTPSIFVKQVGGADRS